LRRKENKKPSGTSERTAERGKEREDSNIWTKKEDTFHLTSAEEEEDLRLDKTGG